MPSIVLQAPRVALFSRKAVINQQKEDEDEEKENEEQRRKRRRVGSIKQVCEIVKKHTRGEDQVHRCVLSLAADRVVGQNS